MRSRWLAAGFALLLLASCGSSKHSAAPSTSSSTTIPNAPPTAPPSTTAIPKRCAAYDELALINHSSVAIQQQMQSNWPQYRKKLAVAFARNRTLYLEVAADTTGELHADALIVAAFMPRSRALLLRSTSFDAYRADLNSLSGNAAVREAARALNSDTAHNCPTTPTPTTTG